VRARGEFRAQSKDGSFLKGITEGAWRQISYQPREPLWPLGRSDFQVGLEHPGFIYDQTVAVRLVEGGKVRELPFDPSDFSYPDPGLAAAVRARALGFAGFTVLFPRNAPGVPERTVEFLGANHFKAAARHSDPGVSARAVILNPAQPGGEEFAYFREFWIFVPEPGSSELQVMALMESQNLTGAYRFLIRPGSGTVMDAEARIFLRQGSAWPRKVGIAPMTGMYLFSEKENGSPYDWRPELHGVDALIYADGAGDYFHRPLNNPRKLMISGFDPDRPMGFGLAQKDNNFDHYQDIGRRYDRRTWLWAEPLDPLPPGRLELMEIPSSLEIHDNVLAFWSVDNHWLQERTALHARYRLFWMPPASTPHSLGRVVSNRLLSRTSKDFQEFYLDFEGSVLNSITPVEGLASVVTTGPDNPVLEKSLTKNSVTGGWRLRLRVKPPKEGGFVDNLLGSQEEVDGSQRVSAHLVRGENLPQPISERFLYDFPPR
jgi:glucans biosynthesis protein